MLNTLQIHFYLRYKAKRMLSALQILFYMRYKTALSNIILFNDEKDAQYSIDALLYQIQTFLSNLIQLKDEKDAQCFVDFLVYVILDFFKQYNLN